ncbi:putative PKS/NRPS-like protein biosynthetic cluster [Orbilia oligospora]|uniref:Putative PKS/NRPS-like protein biosynthetic cluster n=1 Tax=Orbilia oligospora TaxID=2813651 RepID=A0A8H2E1B6_ORBOL|nr:putative PKS/NRPS-like protein biosynthetic cluster [Orbilia oligospora]
MAAEPLAIIGFAPKFPSGIENTQAFWAMMMNGDTGLSEIPDDRSQSGTRHKGYFMAGDIGAFDASFFSISAEAAIAMDPQQRLLLETTYHALENVGLPLSKVTGSRTSVHIGYLSYDYRLSIGRDAESAKKYSITGSDGSILANRLSWYYNLKGPSMAIETACSSSLVALDLASQLLRAEETDMAIVGGVNSIKPEFNHTIRAVIRSTGTNSDGYTLGLTQPSGKAQISLMKDTYEKAGLDIEPTRFCEAHGTGTLLGDPIESAAIGTVFGPARSSDDHFICKEISPQAESYESCSYNRSIERSDTDIADLITLNPEIDGTYYRLKALYFPTEATPWPSAGVRRASVNSFGFGGTNAHVILDHAKGFLAEKALDVNHNTDMEEFKEDLTSQSYLIVLSAADRNGVQRLSESYTRFFAERPLQNNDMYRRLSYTLNNHRTSLPWKSYSIVNSKDSILSLDNKLSAPQRSAGPKDLKLAFVFTGQGARRPGMGDGLMQYPSFLEMRPAIVLGHSSGGVAVAYCKGAISHLSAIKIAYDRGLGGAAASRDPIKRSMMSVGLSEADAIATLKEISVEFDDVHVACINSPSNVTIAGDDGHLNALKAILDQKGTFARKLKVSCAYHSPHMIPVANEYFSRAGKIEPRVKGPIHQPIPMISYIDGDMSPWGISITNILEIGPHAALKEPLREIMQKTFRSARDIKYDSALIRGFSGQDSILRAARSLHSYGFDLDTDYLNGIDSRRVPQLVDLPCYPFSHNRTYWNESRRSHMEKLRTRRPNEILGNPSPDWHPFSATWRNFLSRANMDWVEDHNINDAVLYPGAGMLAMVIEAMNQLVRETLDAIPSAFNLKHIEFLAAIQIPAAPSDQWKKNCKGLVRGDREAANPSGIVSPGTDGSSTPNSEDKFQFSDDECTTPCTPNSSIESTDGKGLLGEAGHLSLPKPTKLASASVSVPIHKFFDSIKRAGYNYGLAFQRISELRHPAPGRAQAKSISYIDHIIHPATLDTVFQLPLANIVREQPNMPTMIPSKIKHLWLSRSGLNDSRKPLLATALHHFSGYRGSEHSVSAIDVSDGSTKITVSGYEMIRVSGGGHGPQDITPNELHHCWKFKWDPISSLEELNTAINTKFEETTMSTAEIHLHNPKSTAVDLVHVLRDNMQATQSCECKIVVSALEPTSAADLKVSLWDVDNSSILENLDKFNLSVVQKTLGTSRNHVLWIQTSELSSASYPSQHLVDGLARVLRQENSMAGFATLLLAGQDLSERVNGIAQVCDVLLSDVDNLFLPQTFCQTGSGIIEYCQLDKAAELTKKVQSVKAGPVSTTRKWGELGPLRIHVGSPGVLESIYFTEDTGNRASITLPDDIVEVEVHAAGVNFKDCLIALGALNESTIGSEISGIVSQIGKDIQGHGLKPGDRAAIQIAQHLGATVFATVSTQEKRDLLTSRYNIPPTHIFNSRDSKFAGKINCLVGGVDVVLNSLSGDVLFSSWECIAPFGRSTEISKKDIQAQGKLPMAQFEKNISFSAVDLGHMHQKRPQYVAQLINEVLERFGTAEKGLRPVSTVQTFDISRIVDAFRLIGTGKSHQLAKLLWSQLQNFCQNSHPTLHT